jgi:uncharacterized membrane protein
LFDAGFLLLVIPATARAGNARERRSRPARASARMARVKPESSVFHASAQRRWIPAFAAMTKSDCGRFAMEKGRLEAFTDGVIAVIITIMVLELKAPHEATWEALLAHWPVLLSYLLSFIYVGIYWNNHHHMMHLVRHVDGRALWANLHLLFWLSLIPFATSWLNEVHPWPAAVPAAVYGIVLLMAALAWMPLSRSLIAANGGADGALARAFGRDAKAWISLAGYAAGIVFAFFAPIVSCAFYAAVAALWFVPDRRIENKSQHP